MTVRGDRPAEAWWSRAVGSGPYHRRAVRLGRWKGMSGWMGALGRLRKRRTRGRLRYRARRRNCALPRAQH